MRRAAKTADRQGSRVRGPPLVIIITTASTRLRPQNDSLNVDRKVIIQNMNRVWVAILRPREWNLWLCHQLWLRCMISALLVWASVVVKRPTYASTLGGGPCTGSFPCCATYPCLEDPDKMPLYLGYLVPTFDEPWLLSTRAIAEAAVDIINSDPNILPYHQVFIVYGRAELTESSGIFATLELLLWQGGSLQPKTEPGRIKVICGPVSSLEATKAALVASRFEVPLVTNAMSNELNDMDRFPMHSTTVPSSLTEGELHAQMAYELGWRRVSVFARSDEVGSSYLDGFVQRAVELELEVVTVVLFNEDIIMDPTAQVKLLRNSGVRVFFGFIWFTNRFFPAADKLGLLDSRYTWVGDFSMWRLFADETVDPSIFPKTEGILNGGMYHDRESAEFKLLARTIDAKYAADPTSTSNRTSTDIDSWTVQIYETVQLSARALNNLYLKGVEPSNATGSRVLESIRSTTYSSLTGQVDIDDRGRRLGSFILASLVWDKEKHEHRYNNVATLASNRFPTLQLNDEASPIVWRTGLTETPEDSLITVPVYLSIDRAHFDVVLVFCCIGIAGALICLFFNIYWRNSPDIKLSSPDINNIIIAGCILSYIAVILLGMDFNTIGDNSISFAYACNWGTALQTYSFTLAFGGLFTKTYRVHKIFSAAKNFRTVSIRSRDLVMAIIIMLVIDTVVLGVWMGLEPMEERLVLLEKMDDPEHLDQQLQFQLQECWSPHKADFLSIIYAYKGTIIVIGSILVFETRNVSIQQLNDSKKIGLCIYNSLIIAIVGVFTARFMRPDAPTAGFVLFSIGIWANVTAILVMLFGSKMYHVYEQYKKTKHMMAISDESALRITMGGANHQYIVQPKATTATPKGSSGHLIPNHSNSNSLSFPPCEHSAKHKTHPEEK